MYGTSLGGIEQLMMLVPNFPQRRSGIVINNHFNCEGGIKICNGCVEKVKRRGNPNDCFCFKEKLEAGAEHTYLESEGDRNLRF